MLAHLAILVGIGFLPSSSSSFSLFPLFYAMIMTDYKISETA